MFYSLVFSDLQGNYLVADAFTSKKLAEQKAVSFLYLFKDVQKVQVHCFYPCGNGHFEERSSFLIDRESSLFKRYCKDGNSLF